VQEFKVEWNSIPPQYGYHSTATVNTVTKSGTNEFHGDLFEFLRNGNLNARNFFATRRDTLKRNQFGGVIGGPIKKDKLFFFAGYQRTTLRSDPPQNTAFIPTAAMSQGDFSGISTPLPASLGFVNNRLPLTSLNPVALNIYKTMPPAIDARGRTIFGLVANQDEHLATSKVDYQASGKHSFFGRYMVANLLQKSTFDGKNPLSINNYGLDDYVYGVALGHTWVISPTMVSSLRLGANRSNIVKTEDNYGSFADFGANVSPLGGRVINVNVSGAFMIGGGAATPGKSHNGPLWSIAEDLNWIKGSHQITFGGGIFQQRLNYWSAGGVNATGAATFDGTAVSGACSPAERTAGCLPVPLVDFMIGRPNSWSQGTVYGYYSRQYYSSLYIQDSWKAHRRLTINYGVRWEPYTAAYQSRSHQNLHFNHDLFARNVRSSYYRFAPSGLVFSGDPEYACGNYFNCPRWAKFFPRVGLAWDPFGDGRTTIRAGYGMMGDRMSLLSLSQEQFGAPFGSRVDVAGTNLTNPWAAYPGGAGGLLPPGQNPMAILAARSGFGYVAPDVPFVTFGSYVGSPLRGFQPTYVNQWNLSIQRQMGKDWLLSANYVGNSTIHLVSGQNLNPAVFLGTNPCTLQTVTGPVNYPVCSTTANQNQRRVLYLQDPARGQFYAGIGMVDDGGTASYHGLNLSVQKRMSRGMNILANYTYSHCISDPWFQNPTAGNGNTIPGNRRAWRSNCQGIDLRQLFQFTMVATTPRFNGRALRLMASDWQFAPNLEIKSAQFFTVVAGADRALTAVPGTQQPPNLVDTNPYPANQSVDNWVNRSAFVAAPLGSYGNLGYNNLRGPGIFQLNMALSRNFTIRERQTLQVRAEAFNLPNHLNPFPPGVGPISGGNYGGLLSLTAPNFGQITNDISGTGGLSPGNHRIIQLAMKYIF
jgi:hypothetical protein